MKFSVFAKKLYSTISGGEKIQGFTRELFESIVIEEGLQKGQNKDAKTCFKTAYNIYSRLAKNEKTFAADAEFVMNVDTYTNEGFTPWIGNHSHYN